jgi:hypothetical protein
MNITTVAIPSVIFIALLLTGMGIFAICRKYVNLNFFNFSLIIYISGLLVDFSHYSDKSFLRKGRRVCLGSQFEDIQSAQSAHHS